MKRALILFALTALAVAAWAITHRARGIGVVEGGSWAGAHFDFYVQQPENPNSPNRFYFWDHGQFVAVDIYITELDSEVQWGRATARFNGMGTYNGSAAQISVFVLDGGRSRPDRFTMECRAMNGQLMHSANGVLTEGDLTVSHPQ
ncbi:MAG: hypothetical protein H0W86_10900 [Armatimonadetes bacterium]|nr:hypothetical protein [Armatimonadota bacterium]